MPLQDYLPPKVQEAFIATLTEFVLLPWREAMRTALNGASQGGSQVCLWFFEILTLNRH